MSDASTHDSRGGSGPDGPKGPARPSGIAPSSGRLKAGAIFAGRYEVGEVLGDGACGRVYAARRSGDGLEVALKVIHPHLVSDEQVSKRFLREAEILRKLDGANIARIHDSGQDADGLLYMALELVEGEPLGALMEREPELPMPAVLEILLGICEALAVAHDAGIIHRDLKPDNVMVSWDGERIRALHVLDFGLSKMLHGHLVGSTNLTAQNMVLGTPEYMAPEQARGEDIDGRCDLYSAGVMLYELLAGHRPFEGRIPLVVLTAHLTQAPPELLTRPSGAAIPLSLAAVAMHALAKKRGERYPDASAMADALRHGIAAPLDLESVRPPAARESLAFRDTDRFSVIHPSKIAAAPSLPEAQSRIPAWLLVSVSAAAIGVLVGILVALRC